MRELKLTLPWPPSVNHYKTIGRTVKTKSGKMYQQRINSKETIGYYYQVYMISKQTIPIEWPKFDDTATFSVNLYVYPPDERKRDIDNILKVLLDSLVHAQIITDDSKINRLYVEKCSSISQGQVLVTIQEL